jgi:hydrogenase-4 component E
MTPSAAALINSLSGLLILTSLLVIEAKNLRLSAIYYSAQSMVLVLIFLALAVTMETEQLYWWAASAFVTKVLLVPFILYRAQKGVPEADQVQMSIKPAVSLLLAAVTLVISFVVVSQLDLKIATEFKPALSVSVAHFFFGELCILTQRNMLKQVLGFCLMENGSHLTLALLAYNAPELVEVGIATDAVFGVVIMVVLALQIYKSLHTLDVARLTTLKG